MAELHPGKNEREQNILRWKESAEDQMSELEELAQTKMPDGRKGFTVGMTHALALFHEGSDTWVDLSDSEREEFLEGISLGLGVDLLHYSPDDVLRSYIEEGIPGSRGEKGADIDELATRFPRWNLKVYHYREAALPTEYDILRVRINRWQNKIKRNFPTKNTAHGGIS